MPRHDAEMEIILRATYWFVLSKLSFGIAGVIWVIEIGAITLPIAVFLSIIAVAFSAQSLKMLRIYMRIKRPYREIAEEHEKKKQETATQKKP